ncbi:MAG: winged helix-turn-helix domain-containing protein [Acidimicrobiia bacterium]|nr:winged helix-turn-helix domain-containing protein [Acidimicrobiia bacterium]
MVADDPASVPGQPHATGRLRFGSARLDLGARQLVVEGRPVDLEPRTFDVLAYLVVHRNRAVPKGELLDALWGDQFVGDSALSSQVKLARAALGDDGRSQTHIRTVHRVGYRFVADVEAVAPSAFDGEPNVDEAARGHRPDNDSGGNGASGRLRATRHTGTNWATPVARGLLGREADIAAVRQRLDSDQVVMITGPAGVGKTAVAHALAPGAGSEQAATSWWCCDLLTTRDPTALALVVLEALGEAQQGGADPTESLLRLVEARSGVVRLDNCEHLLDAAADLAGLLVHRAPAVRVLATSRQPLDVPGETVYPLAPLDVDAAVAVFVRSAADHGVAIDVADPAVAELCDRLDRIPLALELAAARSRVATPVQLVEFLTDRFRLLRRTDGPEDRSLHAAISSSWEALEPVPQQVLADLSVFVGAFTLDDARAVAMADADPLDAVDHLERLVRRSLVAVGPSIGPRSTFRLLESVRDFAAARMSSAPATQAAHVRHYVERVEHLDAELQTPRLDAAVEQLRAAWPNVRAAVRYAAEVGDVASVRRIVVAVAQYADLFAVHEVGEWCRLAGIDGDVDLDAHPERTAEVVSIRARALAHQGRLAEAPPLAKQALGRHESHATVLSVVWCAYYSGDLERVMDLAPLLVATSRSERGLDRGYADGFQAIVSAVRQEASITSTAVDPARVEDGLLGTFDVFTEGLRLCTADPESAAGLLEAVVEISLRRDYRLLLGAAASTLTQITLPARPLPEAMATLRRTLTRYRERSLWNLISADVVMAARLLADVGDEEMAARLIGARLASGYASGLSEILSLLVQQDLAASLGDAYEPLVAQGRSWRPPEAATRAVDALSVVIDDHDAAR